MTGEVYSLLLDERFSELRGKASEGSLTKAERAELRALKTHQDKAPAVAHRIRVLASQMAQPNRWGLLLLRFSKKFKQNLAELEALIHYGHSQAVWEIAYLSRKQAAQKLSPRESQELDYLRLYHDSPDVLKITRLKLREDFGELSPDERQELTRMHRNLYRQAGVPNQLMDMLWAGNQNNRLDWTHL